MLNAHEADIIANLFYNIDTSVRYELYKGFIADERDYTSALASNFRHPHGIFNTYGIAGLKFKAKWLAKVNDGSYEQKFGCDSMIVFQVGDEVKVCLFEAKWPRVVKDPKYSWDSLQKSSKVSHFTDQIRRQREWAGQAAIWEMFYHEDKVGKVGKVFDANGSTCVKHEYARDYIDGPNCPLSIWDNDDLERLITSSHSAAFDGQNESNLRAMVSDVLQCKFGTLIPMGVYGTGFNLTSSTGASIQIPAFELDDLNDRDGIIGEFMGSYGLEFFQWVKVERDGSEQGVVSSD